MLPAFSLVVATRWRTGELTRLFDSLLAQTHASLDVILDVIVVDQNDDERLVPVLAPYTNRLAIRHIRSESRGHAAANNVGLALAQGEIVCFPDDDCWYAPDHFERAGRLLEEHPDWGGITGSEAPSATASFSRRYDQQAGLLTKPNICRRHTSFTIHVRREKLRGLHFNESLGTGAGTFWGSGEETDFLLRFMEKGNPIQYEPSLTVFHPDWGDGPYAGKAFAKAWRYGVGMGRLLQVHRFPVRTTAKFFFRPLAGGGLTLALGRPAKAVYHWSIFSGRVTGFLASLLLLAPPLPDPIAGQASQAARQAASGTGGR